MKKIIVLLLVVVMCFSLVACGGNSEEMTKYEKYDTLINYLEAEDYESALEEMIKLSQQSSDNKEDNGNANAVPQLPIGQNDNDVDSTQTVTTETIELTVDNWKDFFELQVKPEYRLNAFGEVETVVLSQYLVFKEEYAGRVTCNDVAIEMDRMIQEVTIKVSPAEQSYTLGEAIEKRELQTDIVETMQGGYNSDNSSFYYIDIFSNNYIDVATNINQEDPSHKTVLLVESMDDIEAIRVTGTLTIEK